MIGEEILYGQHQRQQYRSPDLLPEYVFGHQWLKKGSKNIPQQLIYKENDALIVAGLPGVGKSTFINRCLDKNMTYLQVMDYIAENKNSPNPRELGEAFGNMLEDIRSEAVNYPLLIEITALQPIMRLATKSAIEEKGHQANILLLQAPQNISRPEYLPRKQWLGYKRRSQDLFSSLKKKESLFTLEGWNSSVVVTRWAANKIKTVDFQ